MNKNTKIILLSIISVLIIITIVLGITYSFMRPINETSSITSVNLESCANITLTDTGESINLSNSYPMTKNRAFETTPYTFSVSSSCTDGSGFNLYLATLNTNTLSDSSIHYIITEHGNKNVITEGILSEATNGLSDFEDYEIEQLNNGINGTYGSIYTLYNGPLSDTETSYDLYLYIDESVTNETMGQTFSAGVAVKAGEYTPPTLADVCNNGNNLASCITSFYNSYGTDATKIYYHNSSLANGAGDNSYRYAGASEEVNNYVCFGSTASTCPSANLYRIIGVFGSEVKLIKSTSYGNYAWESDWRGQGNTWNSSTKPDIRNTLNTTFLNTLSSTWQNKIATHAYKVGGMTYSNGISRPNTAYNYEVGANSSSTTDNMKIGLMYVSDYGYASSPSYWTTDLSDYDEATGSNWLDLGSVEWTISSEFSGAAFNVESSGRVYGGYRVDNSYAVRPVFYLTSSITYNRGSGTAADPVRIN